MGSARIFNIQKYSIYDGPGIRTLVFFKGCPLNCLWCSNPEGKRARPDILWSAALCSHCGLCAAACPNGVHVMENGGHALAKAECRACGVCGEVCPQRAIKVCGKPMPVSEILKIILEDEAFYKTSGGGATLGGGEPLAQPAAAMDLLRACKNCGIHTAVESCGQASLDTVKSMAPLVDLFLYDIKHMDGDAHKRLTGADNSLILENLAWLLDNGHKMRVRMPLIHGCNADLDEMEKRAVFLERWKDKENFMGIDLLPYHRLGAHKYAQLGEEYGLGADAAVGEDFLAAAVEIFAKHGLKAAIIRH